MCSCVGGFIGANCESECNVKKIIFMRFIIIVVDLGSISLISALATHPNVVSWRSIVTVI